ncbi:O-antigen ligase family protein [Hathewaya histolytica]|uniref:Putative transmembrane protein involved in polysaccharide synthesis n=1 Tax=Hathewaya histolytica TaxID=1498 RepID=A0A4U9RT56_HATHI|nr:O-antigen ligase family protein [Hathewaya histolytica]VTQ94776.1 putative transmembrane protein involved in polysaccharide synthesis [Hathewaya histolytica]
MEKLRSLNFHMLCLYVLLAFCAIPMEFQGKFKIFFVGIFFLINGIYIFINKIEIKVKKVDIILYALITIVSIAILIISPYTIVFTMSIFGFLVILQLSFIPRYKISQEFLNKNIYMIFIISIIIQLILGRYNSLNGRISLSIIRDKNFSAMVMLLFFMYCVKNKFYLGKILSIGTILILNSRASVLTLILFFVVKLFRNTIWLILQKLRLNRIYKLFVLMLIFIISISYIWIFKVTSTYAVKGYQQGLNDISNKMRFAANIYAMDILKDNKEQLMIYGYDSDFKDAFNIYDHGVSDYRRFMGVRLVQPHNSIINIIVRTGIVFSLLYFYILSRIIDKLYTKDNLEYILPYLFSTLFLHELLNSRFLLFWIIVLCLPINKTIKNKKLESLFTKIKVYKVNIKNGVGKCITIKK